MNTKDVPWWGIVSSAAPPVVLAAGWTIAASLQPQPYNPVACTVSGEAQAAWPFAAAMSCHPVTLKARYRLLHGYR